MKAEVKKWLVGIITIVIIVGTVPAGYVYATSTQEKLNQAQEEKKETQSQLQETKENLEELKEEKNNLEVQLNDLNDKLTEVSNNLSDLEGQIVRKEEEIEITQQELEEAKVTERDQYESMKVRIRFMYERNDYALLETLFSTGS